jgi:hypothetical protein
LGVSFDLDGLLRELEDGPVYEFRDWPAAQVALGPSGVCTIWRGPAFAPQAADRAVAEICCGPLAGVTIRRRRTRPMFPRSGRNWVLLGADLYADRGVIGPK